MLFSLPLKIGFNFLIKEFIEKNLEKSVNFLEAKKKAIEPLSKIESRRR